MTAVPRAQALENDTRQVSVDPDSDAVRSLAARLAELDVDRDQQLYEDLPGLHVTTPLRVQK